MSEYWKSTPKYWCKHCKVYVRDTKFERTQHEATGRHQGSLKRFLRDLHRDQEREQREKDRAKAEVERLNGVVSGQLPATSDQSGLGGHPRQKSMNLPVQTGRTQVSAEEQKKQLAQLVELGVAIPQEFRGQMALAGDWEIIPQSLKPSGSLGEDGHEHKVDGETNLASKRKGRDVEDDEDGEDGPKRRKGWGSSIKTYPGVDTGGQDLEALLASRPQDTSGLRATQQAADNETKFIAESREVRPSDRRHHINDNEPAINLEAPGEQRLCVPPVSAADKPPETRAGDDAQAQGGVLFKKQKAKPQIRQK